MDLTDNVAIVTGGARGIGRGIAHCLAEAGAHVAIADLPEARDDALQTAAGIEALGRRALVVDVDVRSEHQVQSAVQTVIESLGRLDILVNNAGVVRVGRAETLPETAWDLVLDVNLKGTFLCSKAVIPQMTAQKSGRIVNISSIAGKTGPPGLTAYTASKFGVVGFTQSLARELAPANVTVNAVCPGEVRTAMWEDVLLPAMSHVRHEPREATFDKVIKEWVPLGRPQTPEDIGECVVYLCRADNVTGVAINVAGGSEMH
ncbi:MAG: SDR family NAD(P)-dependent oxidoreductase [Dehalococcoidia bacterium]|nr:SDR family NAD(P)-dependent oxidoreductase [Dehalococcoidia bacterium]